MTNKVKSFCEQYISLIENEDHEQLWDNAWYKLNSEECEELLNVLESIGINKKDSLNARQELYKCWMGALLNVVPSGKYLYTLMHQDMPCDFALTQSDQNIIVDKLIKENKALTLQKDPAGDLYIERIRH